MQILVTGAAGFIGYHTCKRLLEAGHAVVGIDNVNDYYSPRLKRDRLEILSSAPSFVFHEMDIADAVALGRIFAESQITHVINLAAQAGVRYSLINPSSYIQSNIVGFANILEACRQHNIAHLVYASSSSVYGLNTHMPFSTKDNVDHPMSLYAASKKSNELMAHSYSHLYGLPTTGLRFFTVYGPWGRPDMALHIFTKAILESRPIPLFNHGQLERDFTYIDDIVESMLSILALPAMGNPDWQSEHPDPASSSCPYAVYNIGNNRAISLMDFIHTLEEILGFTAELNLLPMQPGDVKATYADIAPLAAKTGFSPKTPLRTGLTSFVEWYKSYYR